MSRFDSSPWLAAPGLALLALLVLPGAFGGEVMPDPPARHFNDYAGVVPQAAAQELDRTLADFERETSNQILAVVYPKMQTDSSIEDYTVRVAQSWKVGQKGRDNGAVLFVFVQDRKMFLQVGYGLEGALPDAIGKRIIESELKPRFKQGDYAGGLKAGVAAIMAATRGEYKGAENGTRASGNFTPVLVFLLIFVVFIIFGVMRGARGALYGGRGYSTWTGGGWGGGGAGGSW